MVVTFSGEGCGVSGKVFCVSGEGGCDSGGEDEGDHASPERFSKCFDDRRNKDGQSRDNRLIQRNQRKHDDHYEKVNRVGHFDDNGGMRRFGYAVDDNCRNLDRDAGNEHTTVTPESKS
ncbi:hypothetical protein Tco_0317719 [Tanacetum coccineum]